MDRFADFLISVNTRVWDRLWLRRAWLVVLLVIFTVMYAEAAMVDLAREAFEAVRDEHLPEFKEAVWGNFVASWTER